MDFGGRQGFGFLTRKLQKTEVCFSLLLYGRDDLGGQLGCRIFGFVYLFHENLLKAQAALFEGGEATTGEEKMVQDLVLSSWPASTRARVTATSSGLGVDECFLDRGWPSIPNPKFQFPLPASYPQIHLLHRFF